MARFSIRNPYFIVVVCLIICIIGGGALLRMPVDLFPAINLPQVVVATFYNGMPPQDIESDITSPLERFFTLGSGIDHMVSRSMLGVSIIHVFFQPETSADADVTELSNLALADLKRLPPGTLPPVVLKSDASNLPVCLLAVRGRGLTQTQLHDYAEFAIRDQIAVVKGAEIPPPFGGKYRQIMVYADPYKLFSRQLSVMDVVHAVNKGTLILPAGDVKIGPYDYYIYSNSLVSNMDELNQLPLKAVGQSWVRVGDIGKAEDANAIQYNLVRVEGQRSSYISIMKQGGNSNTIDVVNGIRKLAGHLYDVPKQLSANILFDQSVFVKEAIHSVLHEAGMGLLLTSFMILLFLGNLRATSAVLLSIPLSALAAFMVLDLLGKNVNTMILGGLALAFSRVIDNSVISLENIYRHLEEGEAPMKAAEVGGSEVTIAVLAATLVGVVTFFPVTILYGVSKFLFSALALSFCIALLASFLVAMTVIPLFTSRFLKSAPASDEEQAEDMREEEAGGSAAGDIPLHDRPKAAPARGKQSWWARFNSGFNRLFTNLLNTYERSVRWSLRSPWLTIGALLALFLISLAIYPLLGLAFFPRTDAGQFTISFKAPTGSRIELTEEYVAKAEELIKRNIEPKDYHMTVSNIGVVPDFSALYTNNIGPYSATIQTQLTTDHRISSFEYMNRIQRLMQEQMPEARTFFQSGSMVDAVINNGAPAPIDISITSPDMAANYTLAEQLALKIRHLPDIGQVYIPQDMNYPGIRLDIDRVHAAELGLTQEDVIDNVITALNSNIMIAPNYWVDYKSGNDYFLTVQYYEHGSPAIHDTYDLRNVPLRGANLKVSTTLDAVAKLVNLEGPTEIDHYQVQRSMDVYVTPAGEDLSRATKGIQKILAETKHAANIRVNLRGLVEAMNASFRSFAIGFTLSLVLLYLILVAQFRSLIDPVLIMLSVLMGVIGVLVILLVTNTTINVMSLMGMLMLVGVANSNSILIVDFAHKLEAQGASVLDAVVTACRVRLRPILMTSLATIIGMAPMALNLGTGAEQYTPMARAIIGGLTTSVVLTLFIVPAGYLLVYRNKTGGTRNRPQLA